MQRKRIKKYNEGGSTGMGSPLTQGLSQFGMAAGNFIQTEDMADGNYSKGGAFGQGALKGASMGAALGPWGALAGAAIGGAAGLINRGKMQDQLDAEANAKRKAEEERERMLDLAKQQANDAVLDQFPVKGTSAPRYALGGSTIGDPKKKKNTIFDAPRNAKRLAMHDDVLPALTKLNEEEVTMMIDKSIEMEEMLKGKSNKEKMAAFKNMDMSWVKPLREKTGLSKNQIIDAAVESGAVKPWAKMPLKAASPFVNFKMGGSTLGPNYEVEGGEMIQHKPGDTPKTYGQGGMSRVASTEVEVKGPKHSNGGVDASDNKGARVYSDKLTVDSNLISKLSKL